MKNNSFSPKQRLAVSWWLDKKYKNYDAIICDGAIRSGKTFSMSIGFVSWAMTSFNGKCFAFCGKTVKSVKRNVMDNLLSLFRGVGFLCLEKISENYIDIKMHGRCNRFYLFGGKDESSGSLIQGMTLAGVFFDEVALMPQSFVEQALARCSVENSKLWFNCNPDNPSHWFYREWIKSPEKKNALYLHFTMDDNPSLSDKIKNRYKRLYRGVFYERYILGKWVASQGVIYTKFDENIHVLKNSQMPHNFSKYVISCDYGTVNPSSFGLWGKSRNKWYRIDEYYFDSRRTGYSKTDEEHYTSLENLAENRKIDVVICDPSAASFIEVIRRHNKFKVIRAKNDVLDGIRKVSVALSENKIFFSENCKDIIREFHLYCWQESSMKDAPVKENDHAMDDLRYFVSTYLEYDITNPGFFVATLRR